jgi:hypothetical protein
LKLDTLHFTGDHWCYEQQGIHKKSQSQLVLIFGDSDLLKTEDYYHEIRALYPNACIVGASSSGNIQGTEISGSPIVGTAVELEKGMVRISHADLSPGQDLASLCADLVRQLPAEGLKHIFVLSDGLNVNGSELVKGINQVARGIPVTGGMAGDGDRFRETWVIANDRARQGRVVALGFYGDNLEVRTGCQGGWTPFGSERLVTRSAGNVLFELDGQPALDLYKSYLGEFAKDLPMSGMRFPLSVIAPGETHAVIRTLLAIDEDQKCITFAGDIPVGSVARLMKPDLDLLIDGAGKAAGEVGSIEGQQALGLIVSCVGRRVVMKELVAEELDAVRETLGNNLHLTGFYSYGEIAPFSDRPGQCQLHNQTMTLTALYER